MPIIAHQCRSNGIGTDTAIFLLALICIDQNWAEICYQRLTLMFLWNILVIKQPAPERIFGGGGIYNFKAKFKWVILKIKAKMTLLQFFGHISFNYGPI